MNFSESLMNNLSYPKKMGLISLVFMVPILFVSFVLLTELSANITATKQEQSGLSYISTVRQLYQNLPQHRGMTHAYRNGQSDFKNKIIAKRKVITADIAAIDTIDTLLGKEFKTTPLWNEIKQDWSTLQNNAFSEQPQHVFDAHTALISKLYQLIELISNQSGLVLDPKLNTSFIIDSLVYKLPLVTETLGQARGLGSGVAASGRISLQERVKLGSLLAIINTNSTVTQHNLEITLVENPHLTQKLSNLISQRDVAMDNFSGSVTRELLLSDFVTIDSARLFSLGTTAIEANYQLYDTLIPTLDELFDSRIQDYAFQRNLAFILIILAIAISTILFLGFYKSTLSSINEMKAGTSKISAGDLTININSTTKDETSQIVTAINSMTQKLNATITQIHTSASQLASSSEQLSTSTLQVGANISEQQSQTEQIATAMTEMTSTVQDIAKNAELLAVEVKNAEHETTTGSTVINNTINSINTLADGIGNAATVVENLQDSSHEIGSILNVIKGVAEQTNLLALNAAIEAARAGDHGRGFAVVADEVRTLATRTQESAEQIQEMVNALQHTTREATSVMNNEKQKAEEMSVNTQTATTSLENIVNTISKIADMSAQVATAAEEQGAVSEEINRNVIIVSDLSTENMSGTEQVTSSSQELARLARELDDIVSRFKI
jgi:methyl-accepting chemotaxis protein